jgi:hypothetical protein
MSCVLRGQRLQGLRGHRLQGQPLRAQRRDADRTLADRDGWIPALNWILDVELLSELTDERVHITRTRSGTTLGTGWPTLNGTSAELGS